MIHPSAISTWHDVVRSRDPVLLERLLAEEVRFESPVVHAPQVGRAITLKYLMAAMQVLNNESFCYANQWFSASSAVLEFNTTCDEVHINGVDIISWDKHDQIVHFKVMVRPLKAISKLHELMGKQLTH